MRATYFNFKLDDARCASCLAHQDRRRALRVPFGTKDQATHDHITDCALSAFCSACTSRPSDSYSQRSVQPELQLKVRPHSHLTDCDETPPDGRSGRPESPLQSTALYDPYFPRATTRTQGTAYNNPGTIGDDCIDTRGRWGRFTITRGRSIKLRTGQIFSAVFYLGALRNLCVGSFNHSETVIETPSPPSCQAPLCGALGPQRKQLGPSAGADRLQLSCQGSSQPDLPSGKLKSPGYGPTVTLQCHRSNFSCLLQPRQPQEQPTSRTTSAKDLNRLDRQVSPTQIRRKPRSEGRKPAGLPL